MDLLDYLTSRFPDLTAENTKVHFAVRNDDGEDPLVQFIDDKFEEWQSIQKRNNFGRKYVVSLIQAYQTRRWLFAGAFLQNGIKGRFPYGTLKEDHYHYDMTRVPELSEYAGRMYVDFEKQMRMSYLNGETVKGNLSISEISPTRLSFGEFPGYKNVVLERDSIRTILHQNLESWKTALSIVKGIYLLTDHEGGKLYVGKADGAEGIWGRWKEYFKTGHGGNVGLREAFGTGDEERLRKVTFSLLEIMDFNADKKEIDRRESHWKIVLLSRSHGHNRN